MPHPAAPLPQRRRPEPAWLDKVARLADVTRRVSTQLALAPEILATRRDLERLADGQLDGPVLSGWRRAAIGAELLQAL